MKKKPKRLRTEAQIAAEQRREEKFGKTMIRHNEVTLAAMHKVMEREGLSGSGAFCAAIIAYAKQPKPKKEKA